MKAAVLHGPRDLRVQAIAPPEPGAGEVLVQVTLAGLCGTDHRIWSGKRSVRYPRVMGHELVGRLAESGERVVVEPNFSCGACALCREGNRNLCLARTAVGIDVDGGFAKLVRVPSRCCWPAPGPAADEDLLLTEPLAVVVRAVGRGAPKAGETAAVVGAGTLGLLALQVLRARGARVLVVSRTHRRLELATELGAEAVHALADGPLDAAARRVSGREGVDLVVETAGAAEAVGQAPPVRLINGLSAPAVNWALQAKALARHFQVVVFDNRGVGETDLPPEPVYTTGQMAEDAAALLRHLKIARAHVLGASMGGTIAQELALRYKHLVRSLTLLCTWSEADARFLHTVEAWMSLANRVPIEERYRYVVYPWIFSPEFFA